MFNIISIDDGQVLLDMRSAPYQDALDFLRSIGCEKPEDLESVSGYLCLTDTNAWKGGFVPFFLNEGDLWHELRTKPEEPEHYFLVGKSADEISELKRKLKYYFSLRAILKDLCHHEGDDAQPMKYVFFSSKESHLTKFEIPYAMDFAEFDAIYADKSALKKAETLYAAIQQEDDVHFEERKHVMREALLDFFKEDGSRHLKLLMTGLMKFNDAYNERYKVYVSKFSVNKILSEIEAERIGFLGKIQEAIISQQSKAFAVPGGIVAVGAILRLSKNPWDFFIIFIGMVIATWMIISLNKTILSYIKLLSEEFENSVNKYDDIVTGVQEIKEKIVESRTRLCRLASQAETKLNTLNRISWQILILVGLILFGRADLTL